MQQPLIKLVGIGANAASGGPVLWNASWSERTDTGLTGTTWPVSSRRAFVKETAIN